jgi:hypothetical protein
MNIFFSSLKCEKEKKFKIFLRKKKDEEIPFLSQMTFGRFTLVKVGRVVVLAGGLQFKP